jgi:hypothetical protein
MKEAESPTISINKASQSPASRSKEIRQA